MFSWAGAMLFAGIVAGLFGTTALFIALMEEEHPWLAMLLLIVAAGAVGGFLVGASEASRAKVQPQAEAIK